MKQVLPLTYIKNGTFVYFQTKLHDDPASDVEGSPIFRQNDMVISIFKYVPVA